MLPAGVSLRGFDRSQDRRAAHELWSRTLGPRFPVAEKDLARIAAGGFAAVADGRLVGLAALGQAGISALVVDEGLRRRGIGGALHDACLAEARRGGAQLVHLAGDLWPGVPEELADAEAAFRRWGWRFQDPLWDLGRSLGDFEPPPDVGPRASCRWATAADREPLLRFERTHFASWAGLFEEAPERAIVALVDDRLAGALLAHDRLERPWPGLGAVDSVIGAVGVAPEARGRGIGTELMAYACEQLRDRGAGDCLVRSTDRLSFYGRLGFRPTRRYNPAVREL